MFESIERLRTRCDVVNCMKNLCAVVTRPTVIANADGYPLEDYETLFVLKSLAVDLLWSNGSVAVFARVAVRSLISGIC